MNYKILIMTALFCLAKTGGAIDKPYWAGNKLGKEGLSKNYVDPDHAPLSVSRDTVLSGFKRLTLAPSGLPAVISWRDLQMLRQPVKLLAPGLENPATDFSLEKDGGNHARSTSRFTVGNLRYDVAADFDFDFTIRYTITVTPLAPKAETRLLSLVFPLNFTPSCEKLVMYYTEGPAIPESGEDAQSRRIHRTVKGGETEAISPGFCSLFWVGTVNWGVSLNFESAKGWNATGRELVFDPASGDMTVNFIDQPVVLEKPLEFKFFLTPTPVRNMPKNWRAWNYGWRGNPQAQNRENVNQLIYWSSTFRFEGPESFNNHWARNPEELAAAVARDKGMNKAAYYIPQLITSQVAWEDDEGEYYVLEDLYLDELAKRFRRVPGTNRELDVPSDAIRFGSVAEYRKKLGDNFITKNKLRVMSTTRDVIFVPELADHFVWGLNNLIDIGVGGIYYDGINPQQNYADWAAWTDADGNKRPHFHFEEIRELFKRCRYLVKKNDPNEMILAHQSGTRPGATLSLMDAIVPGETFFYWYHPEEKRDASPSGDFYYAHIIGDIDNLKGEFFWRQWGVPHILLPEVRGRDRRMFPNPTRGTRTMLAYTLHFDMLYWPTWCDTKEIYNLYPIRNEYGMADTDKYVVEFVPYWENRWFEVDDPNVKLSYYDHVKEHELYSDFDFTKKIKLIASNLQFSDREFTITLPANLRDVKVREMQTDKEIAVEGGKFKHSLIAYDFAIFEITGEMR